MKQCPYCQQLLTPSPYTVKLEENVDLEIRILICTSNNCNNNFDNQYTKATVYLDNKD